MIEAYGKVRANLLQHEPGFPEAQALLDRVTQGLAGVRPEGVGEGRDSPGSNRIVELLEHGRRSSAVGLGVGRTQHPRPGALQIRKSRSAGEVERLVGKLRVYTISDQDDTGTWIRREFPTLFYIVSPGGYGNGDVDGHQQRHRGDRQLDHQQRVAGRNIQQGHGPLGAAYPDVAYGMEGDTPAWLALVQNGLQVPDRPDWGGWGGRYELYRPDVTPTRCEGLHRGRPDRARRPDRSGRTPSTRSHRDSPATTGAHSRARTARSPDNKVTLWRWRDDFQNDFAARMEW